jgi:surfeit locus 1 family protein
MTGTKRKLPFWATLLTILGVLVLCGLGSWQVQRLQWKQDILDKLEAAYNNPIDNPAIAEMDEDSFTYGKIEGRFLFEKSILLGHTIKNETTGQFLITPLKIDQGTLLINLGFNKYSEPLENHYLEAFSGEAITFTGIIRKPKWNSFTPENDPEKDTWYRLDISQIAKAKGLENPLPMAMYADSASKKFDGQYPNNERWQPNNNHMQYAFFWFTLAGALITIYCLRFLRKN